MRVGRRTWSSLTLSYEENELLGHEDEGQAEEQVLLGEVGKRSCEHAAYAVFRAQSGDI